MVVGSIPERLSYARHSNVKETRDACELYGHEGIELRWTYERCC